MRLGMRDWSDYGDCRCIKEESAYEKELRRKSEERQKLKDMETLVVTARNNPAINPLLVIDMETYVTKLKRGKEND
jgi:hypothetical protein